MSASTITQPNQQEELLKYMKAAIDIETELLTQERILTQCENDINSRRPVLHLKEEPEYPQIQSSEDNINSSILYISGGIALMLSLWGFSKAFVGGMIAILMALVFFGIGLFYKQRSNDTQKQNMEKQLYYEERRQTIHKANQQLKADYHSAIWECRQSIDNIRESMRPHTEKTKALLDKLYSKGIIYPKYCTLPALTSIYEYFITGRCTELTGPHGAYNLYEDELRKDTVISQLNAVIENLEQIKQNPFMLYQQVKAVQENTAEIASELRQIKGYTVQIAQMSALNAYYAALTERNTRITMYYHL